RSGGKQLRPKGQNTGVMVTSEMLGSRPDRHSIAPVLGSNHGEKDHEEVEEVTRPQRRRADGAGGGREDHWGEAGGSAFAEVGGLFHRSNGSTIAFGPTTTRSTPFGTSSAALLWITSILLSLSVVFIAFAAALVSS